MFFPSFFLSHKAFRKVGLFVFRFTNLCFFSLPSRCPLIGPSSPLERGGTKCRGVVPKVPLYGGVARSDGVWSQSSPLERGGAKRRGVQAECPPPPSGTPPREENFNLSHAYAWGAPMGRNYRRNGYLSKGHSGHKACKTRVNTNAFFQVHNRTCGN